LSEEKKHKPQRNADGTFPAGVSGNPAGRPKGALGLTATVKGSMAKRAIEIRQVALMAQELGFDPKEVSVGEVIVQAGCVHAIKGNVAWFKEFIDRVDGKVTDKVEVQEDIIVRFVDPEDENNDNTGNGRGNDGDEDEAVFDEETG